MKIEFLEPAYNEYLDAVKYYDLQLKGLGGKFISEVDRTISIIKNYPDVFSNYSKHTRKAVLTAFPYNIIYYHTENKIIIAAVAHQHRKPGYWHKS